MLRGPSTKKERKVDQELMELMSVVVRISLLTWFCTTDD